MNLLDSPRHIPLNNIQVQVFIWEAERRLLGGVKNVPRKGSRSVKGVILSKHLPLWCTLPNKMLQRGPKYQS